MPYTDVVMEQFISIPNLFIEKSHPVAIDKYAKVRFTKSSRTTLYTRSFNKIDNYLSYIAIKDYNVG